MLKYKVDDLQTNVNKIPSDLNEEWETVKANADKVPGIESSIPTIPSDLNEEWETVKTNASNPTTSIFYQSIIDYITTNNPNGNLFETITNNTSFPTTIKTTISDDPIIFPRTTNTLITIYYSSYVDDYIPSYVDNTYRVLLAFSTESSELFNIGVINSTSNIPGVLIRIKKPDGTAYKTYKATKETPMIVCDLTTDLAAARPGEVIKSAKFSQSSSSPYARSQTDFFQDCVNILSNVFISYTYKD
jgi:hypothetical protein